MDSCPDVEELIGAAEGAAPSTASRQAALRHLSLCESCRLVVSTRLEAAPASHAALRRLLPSWRTAAAAAGILLLAGTAVLRLSHSRTEFLPALTGRPVAGISERLNAGETVALPDGTRIEARSGATARFVPASGGERHRLALERGEIAADISAGPGALAVSTPCGEVRVLGTRFTARVVRFPFEIPLSVAVVEVSEGKVLIANPSGEAPLPAGHRGILAAGRSPVGPIHSLDPPASSAWEGVRQLAREDRPAARWATLLLLINGHRHASAALLAGFPGEKDPQVREMAARCIVALGSRAEVDRLIAHLHQGGEPDLAVRVERWRGPQ